MNYDIQTEVESGYASTATETEKYDYKWLKEVEFIGSENAVRLFNAYRDYVLCCDEKGLEPEIKETPCMGNGDTQLIFSAYRGTIYISAKNGWCESGSDEEINEGDKIVDVEECIYDLFVSIADDLAYDYMLEIKNTTDEELFDD